MVMRTPMGTPSSPINLLGYQQAQIARLTVTLGVVSFAVALLGSILAWQAWHGLPIHYLPPGGPGLSQPGVIPDTVALDYASRCLRARYTFTPSTIKAAHAEFLTCLHPTLTVTFKAQVEREAMMVKTVQLSTQVAILESTVLKKASDAVTVRLDGQRTIWIGGQQVREEPIQAEMVLVPWITHGLPAGLVVARVNMTPALSASGQ
jgi:hypothetical protein